MDTILKEPVRTLPACLAVDLHKAILLGHAIDEPNAATVFPAVDRHHDFRVAWWQIDRLAHNNVLGPGLSEAQVVTVDFQSQTDLGRVGLLDGGGFHE